MPQAMPTRDDIFQAIRNADAAGDTASVQKLAAYLTNMDGAAHAQAQAGTDAWAKTINPADGGGTLQIGPLDTGIGTPQWLDRGLAGAGKMYTDVARGAGQLVGAVSRQDVANSRTQDAPLMATTAGKVGVGIGGLALFAPTALIPGANTITGGAAIGAATGLLQPSTSTGETLQNVATGGVAGAAVPAVVKGLQIAKAAAEPFYEAGKNRIVGRALIRAAGSDAPVVAQRLQDAAAPFVGPSQGVPRTTMGELVPGSVPTVGQAAGNPGVAALERAATAANPDVTNAVSQRIGQQNAARVAELSDVAGSDGARDFYSAARNATADQLYGQARAAGIDPARLTPDVIQQMQSLQQRIPQAVLDRAKEIAAIKGEPMTDATSISGLHYVKQAIDDLIGGADRAGNNTLKAAYTGLQKDLLSTMDKVSPAYAGARQTYSAMSRPINQMDIAQAIADKSVNKLSGNLQPNAYANALTDGTAARVTGMPGATLESVMAPNQLSRLQAILSDVQRSSAAQNAGRGVGSDTVQKLAYSNVLEQAGLPTFLRAFSPAQVVGNLAARGADAAYGRANRELSNRLAAVMLDPQEAATVMLTATPKQQSQLLQLLGRGGSALSLAAPPTANAQKQ